MSRPTGTSLRQYSQSHAHSRSPCHPRFHDDQSPCHAPAGSGAARSAMAAIRSAVPSAIGASEGASTAAKRSRSRCPMGSSPGLTGRTALTTWDTRGAGAPASGSKRRKGGMGSVRTTGNPRCSTTASGRGATTGPSARSARPSRARCSASTFAAVTSFQATFAYARTRPSALSTCTTGLRNGPGGRTAAASATGSPSAAPIATASGSSPTSHRRSRNSGRATREPTAQAAIVLPACARRWRVPAPARNAARAALPFAGTMARARRPRGTIV